MKVYVISEIGYEYNDETYDRVGHGGTPVKAYKKRENAVVACQRMNAERIAKEIDPMEDSDGAVISEFYSVSEIDIDESDLSYTDARKTIESAKKVAQAVAKKEFHDGAKKLFDENPTLTSFGWNQYTPYFNDGDPCYFGVNTDDPKINGHDNMRLDSGERWDSSKQEMIRYSDPSVEYLLSKKVTAFLAQFDEDDFEAMFGDHTQVTIHRDGKTEINSFDHD